MVGYIYKLHQAHVYLPVEFHSFSNNIIISIFVVLARLAAIHAQLLPQIALNAAIMASEQTTSNLQIQTHALCHAILQQDIFNHYLQMIINVSLAEQGLTVMTLAVGLVGHHAPLDVIHVLGVI